MKRVLFLTAAICAACSIVTAQDQQPTGYHNVTCVKVVDGKGPEFREFLETNRKIGQVAVDSGRSTTSYRLRSIMPAGAAATCDYVFISMYKGAPPAPNATDTLPESLQKAGISMSAAEYRSRLNSVGRLVSSELWRTAISVGEMQKGDYVYINHMKVHDAANWMEMERSIWKPMAEAWAKDHSQRGWVVAQPVLPSGTDLKYQAITADVFPSWDAAFAQRPVDKTFKQIHPDKDIDKTFEKLGKVRDLALREFMVVEDKIVPSGKAPAIGQP